MSKTTKTHPFRVQAGIPEKRKKYWWQDPELSKPEKIEDPAKRQQALETVKEIQRLMKTNKIKFEREAGGWRRSEAKRRRKNIRQLEKKIEVPDPDDSNDADLYAQEKQKLEIW